MQRILDQDIFVFSLHIQLQFHLSRTNYLQFCLVTNENIEWYEWLVIAHCFLACALM
jgi:hypothetical protein